MRPKYLLEVICWAAVIILGAHLLLLTLAELLW